MTTNIYIIMLLLSMLIMAVAVFYICEVKLDKYRNEIKSLEESNKTLSSYAKQLEVRIDYLVED